MPTFRLYPNSDDGPNTFTGALPHWARIDEDVEAPNIANFIRATNNGFLDRHGYTSVPTGLTNCHAATLRIHHRMTNGGAMSGTMQFNVLAYVDGVVIGSAAVPIGNNDGPRTDAFLLGPFSLTKAQVEAVQIEWNSDSVDPTDWLGISPRWDIYAVNLDIEYTETEKILIAIPAIEKVIASTVSTEKVIVPTIP